MLKLQSAMEYLTTYGWAILIISLALVAIFALIGSPQSNECLLPGGFSCINYFMAQNGMLSLNLLQSTQNPISITAIGCNNPETVWYMDPANQPYSSTLPANVPIGSNYTASIQCYSNGTRFFGSIGQYYSGYVIINYTNAYTNFPNTVYGKINVKIIK